MLFSKPSNAIGLDIGTSSVKAVQMSIRSGRLSVDRVGLALIDRNEMNADPIMAQASAVSEALQSFSVSQSLVVGAIPGQSVVIRYPRLPEMEEAQLAQSIENEAGQNIPYELSEVFLDWTLLDRVTEGEKTMMKVLLVAARYEVIESRVQIADAAAISYGALGVDSLALADAAEGCDFLRVGESVALVNLGSTNTSIHFVKDGISNFIRDVNWGSREFTQAIAKGRRCDLNEAERLLHQASAEEPPPEEPPPLPGGQEPIADVLEESPAQDSGSSDVLGDMGGGLLDPLEDELGSMGLEPTAPTSQPTAAFGTDLDEEGKIEDLLKTPLTRLVTEIRRSFDFYEQQLYERAVDRLVLSGGAAHFPLLRETLGEELGIGVEVANPTESALTFSSDEGRSLMADQPAQFLVAVGLAARGVTQL